MASVSPAVVKNTQNSLGKFVTKPPLTEKLLKKPPFRFLHDVVSVTIRDYGILDGLFDPDEMNSDNVKDRDSKIKYLDKLIACLSAATGTSLTAKPGKIVAGQEPEKTNEMLQALAKVLNKKLDTSEAVAKVRSGALDVKKGKAGRSGQGGKENDVPAGSGKSTNKRSSSREKSEANKASSRSNSRSRESTANSNRGRSSTSRVPAEVSADAVSGGEDAPSLPLDNDNGGMDSGLGTLKEEDLPESGPPAATGDDSSMANLQQDQVADTGRPTSNHSPKTNESEAHSGSMANGHHVDEHADSVHQHKEMDRDGSGAIEEQDLTSQPEATSMTTNPPAASPLNTIESTANQVDEDAKSGTVSAAPAGPVPRPGSAMKSARPRTGRLKSGRPPSARPAAPRIRDKAEILAQEEIQARPMTGKVANVIVAGDDKEDDDDGEDFIVEEKPKDELDLLTESPNAQTDASALESGGQEHGALVQQILETQKALDEPTQPKPGVEIEREGGLSDVGRRRDREATQREVDKLRGSIQTLTKSANPLGKLMDFLQEDVDAMQRELDTWKKENQSLQQDLKHEESLTEKSIEPLKTHLADLEAAIQEQLDKISVVKSNILKNDEKMSKMILTIGTAAR